MFDNGSLISPCSPAISIPNLQTSNPCISSLSYTRLSKRNRLTSVCKKGKPIYHLLNHPIKWVRITGVVVAVDDFSERRVLTIDDSSGSCIECVCALPPTSSTTIAATTVPAHLNQKQNQFQLQMTYAKDGKTGTALEVGQGDKGKDGTNGRAFSKGGKGKETSQPSVQNPLIFWDGIDVGSVLKIKGHVTAFRDVKQVDVIKIDVIRGTDSEVKCWEEVYTFRQTVLSKAWVVTEEESAKCLEKDKAREKASKRRKDSGRSGDKNKRVDRRRQEDGRDKGTSKTRIGTEVEEENSHRHGIKKRKRLKEKEAEGLDPANKVNYPSTVVRCRVAGKYDTLGI